MYEAETIIYLAVAPTLFLVTSGFALYQIVRLIHAKDRKRVAIAAGISSLWLVMSVVVVGIVIFVSAAHSNIAAVVTLLRVTSGVYFIVGMLFLGVLAKLGSNATPTG